MFVRYFTQIPPMTPVTRGKPTLRRKWRKPLWGQHEVSKCSTMRSQLKENLWEHNRNPNRNMSKFLTGTLQTRTIRSRSWGSLLQLHWLERRTSSLLMVCTRWLEFEVLKHIQSMCFFFSLTSHGIALQNSTISTLRMLLVCPPILMFQRWKILKAEWKIHQSMLRTSRTWPGLVPPAFWTFPIVLPRARAFLI